jgi:hypothetical protein
VASFVKHDCKESLNYVVRGLDPFHRDVQGHRRFQESSRMALQKPCETHDFVRPRSLDREIDLSNQLKRRLYDSQRKKMKGRKQIYNNNICSNSEQGENKMKAFISQRREWNAVEIRHAKWAE